MDVGMNAAATVGDKGQVRKTVFLGGTWALSLACLVWVLHDIDFTSLIDNVEHMHWGWVAVAMISDILVYCYQGWRWSLVLRPLSKIPVWQTAKAIYVGLFANEVLPFRTGEVIRCYLLGRWTTLPFSVTLSSALIERIFDGVWLVSCLLVAMRLVHLPKYLLEGGTTLAIFVLAGAALLGAAMYWKEDAHAALSGNRFLRKVAVLIEDLHIIGHSRYLYISGMASLPYLLLQVIPIYALGQAYDIDLTLTDAFIVMVLLRFSSVVPQAPGNLGLFQAAAVLALKAIGVEESISKEFAIVLWAVITLPLLGGGFLALAVTGLRINELRHEAHSNLKPAR
jgi:glycosyltransferase 2 family protein